MEPNTGIHYWLANHPTIVNFSWTPDQTFGGSALFVAVALISYLSLIFLLPRLPLPTFHPNTLRPIKIVHSVFLFFLSIAMVAGSILCFISHTSRENLDRFLCYPPKTKPSGPFFFWAYVFYLSKILEFVDTLLIILSRSNKRLTFLHVYHHCMAVIMCYNSLRMVQSMFPVVIIVNSSVHIMMYGYYSICAMGMTPKWKRKVTECQIAQFALSFFAVGLLLYFHFTGMGCSGMWSWCFNVVFNATLLVLFLDFHAKNYGKTNTSKFHKKDK
ncbi:hypothetical protein UlMin_033753 [Ulmus minor]